MIKIKNKQAIAKMRYAGQVMAQILEEIRPLVVPNISTLELDAFIDEKMIAHGVVPECKRYKNYKHATCISVNDVVVHGIPSSSVRLKEGDIVKIDVVGSYKGYCADMARPFFVGNPSAVAQRLVKTAQKALDTAIAMIRPGVHLSDVSACIQTIVEADGFGVVRAFAGHGIGKSMHEDPEVPNFGEPGEGPLLRPGMVLAIEPMITEKGYDVYITNDGWTAKTVDGGLAGHIEDTVVVTEKGAEVLTRVNAKGESL